MRPLLTVALLLSACNTYIDHTQEDAGPDQLDAGTMDAGAMDAGTMDASVTPDATRALNNGWLLYHVEVQSCFPDYSGPAVSVYLDNVAELPVCDEGRQNTTACLSQTDGSPSACQNCETSLYICAPL